MLFRLEMKLALFGDFSKSKMMIKSKLKKKKNKKNSIKRS
jgi:hypothetical protein